jgi:3-phosphoshikimate 1-carboxyvinyltransferase
MSQLIIRRSAPLRGCIRVAGDKSVSHRSLLLGALAEGTSRVAGFLPAADCRATLHTVRALGIEIEEPAPPSSTGATLIVHGRGWRGLREPDSVLDCSRSGTTMRLLAGILAGQPFLSILSGDPQLRRRPMGRIAEPLRQMGAMVLGREGGRLPPLAIQGGNLHGLDYTLPVASAQVKSALLLAGLFAADATCLRVPGPARDHTERMLMAMGAELDLEDWSPDTGGQQLSLEPGRPLQPVDTVVPGDFSSAAFVLVAAALVPGSEVTVEGVGVNPTRTGLLDVLQAMGAEVVMADEHLVSGEPVASITVRSSQLRGMEVGGDLVVRAIDEFPVLAVAASQAQGETIVRDAAELRVKETDRIATTVQELRRMGADIEALPDGFAVRGPKPLRSPELAWGPDAAVHSHGDHRLAMALAVAGLIASGETRVEDTDCIADSFPGFVEAFVRLGGEIR